MTSLVTLGTDNELVTTSLAIAEGVGYTHKSVIEQVRTHQNDLEEFGQVTFETAPAYNGSVTTFAILNEQQTSLLLTYMRNSTVVKQFKIRLVKEFYAMRDKLRSKTPQTYLAALEELVASIKLKEEAEKKVELLTDALDRNFSYVSIIRAASFIGVKETVFDWHPLKAASIRMGCPPKKVPSPHYEYQLIYPIAAFVECYPQFDFSGLTPDGVSSIARLTGE